MDENKSNDFEISVSEEKNKKNGFRINVKCTNLNIKPENIDYQSLLITLIEEVDLETNEISKTQKITNIVNRKNKLKIFNNNPSSEIHDYDLKNFELVDSNKANSEFKFSKGYKKTKKIKSENILITKIFVMDNVLNTENMTEFRTILKKSNKKIQNCEYIENESADLSKIVTSTDKYKQNLEKHVENLDHLINQKHYQNENYLTETQSSFSDSNEAIEETEIKQDKYIIPLAENEESSHSSDEKKIDNLKICETLDISPSFLCLKNEDFTEDFNYEGDSICEKELNNKWLFTKLENQPIDERFKNEFKRPKILFLSSDLNKTNETISKILTSEGIDLKSMKTMEQMKFEKTSAKILSDQSLTEKNNSELKMKLKKKKKKNNKK